VEAFAVSLAPCPSSSPSLSSLRVLAASGRSTLGLCEQMVEAPGALRGLFPEGGLHRGSVTVLSGGAMAWNLSLWLTATAQRQLRWAAAVGLPSLGLVAASEAGVCLEHLALVPEPGERWPSVTAALVEGFDWLLLGCPLHPPASQVRKLVAKVRERGALLVVVDGDGWPCSPDYLLRARPRKWMGLGKGSGRLLGAEVEVVRSGRRGGGCQRRLRVSLGAPEAKKSSGCVLRELSTSESRLLAR